MPEIVRFNESGWAKNTAILIQSRLDEFMLNKVSPTFFLTGGRTAATVYREWAKLKSFREMEGVKFYFGDERVVPIHDNESNYQMVMTNLFYDPLIAAKHEIFYIDTNFSSIEEMARNYEMSLPKKIDFLLLSLGDDGHIASLFPNNMALQEKERKVLGVDYGGDSLKRITITPPFISSSNTVIVMAKGPIKNKVFNLLFEKNVNYLNLPAYLVFDALWILEKN